MTVFRHSRCLVPYRCSVLVSERDQYSKEFVLLAGCFCIKRRSINLLHASVSSVKCPPEYGSAGTDRYIRAFLSLFMT